MGELEIFKSLVHSFYYISMKEMQNIFKMKESDERFEIMQLTEKALARHNKRKAQADISMGNPRKRLNAGVG